MELRFLKVSVDSHGRPKISFNGDWLARAGFNVDTLAMAGFSMGEAVFTLCDMDADGAYSLICAARKDGHRLLRVSSCLSRGKRRPILNVSGAWLAEFGFSTGTHIAVVTEHGSVRAKAVDTSLFG